MKRIPDELFSRMAGMLSPEDRDEMAIPSYRHRNPAMRWMAWRRIEVVAHFMAAACAARTDGAVRDIMDYGCGSGVLFEQASRHAARVYGIDPVLDAARLLVAEWKLDEVTLLTPQDAESAIPGDGVDIIIAAEVLEHIEPVEPVLDFFRSRLRPEGQLLVSLPTEGWLYRMGRRIAGFHGHYHVSNAASIQQKILDAGFRTKRIAKIPAPGPLAIYWVIAYDVG